MLRWFFLVRRGDGFQSYIEAVSEIHYMYFFLKETDSVLFNLPTPLHEMMWTD